MIGRTNTGGGASLAFRVIGNPIPGNPKSNDIWVNTDERITSYIFASTEPTDKEEGMVWFFTDPSSDVAFSATKKNAIMVYPASAKQYVGGTWVNKDAKIYQNGSWVEWWVWDESSLFSNGDEAIPITGGWTSHHYAPSTSYSGVDATIENDGSTINVTLTTTKNSQSSFIGTQNYIDLSNYKTLEIKISERTGFSSSNGGVMSVRVYDESGKSVAETANFYSVGTRTVDVSALTGKYRVGVLIWSAAARTLSFKMEYARIKK